MSEFALPVAQRGGFSVPQVPSAPPASNVEWYSGGGAAGSQFASASSPYAAYSAPSSSGAAAYGSFEDEAPLLEGGRGAGPGAAPPGERADAACRFSSSPHPPPTTSTLRLTRSSETDWCDPPFPCDPDPMGWCRAGRRHPRHPEPHALHPHLPPGRAGPRLAGSRGAPHLHGPPWPRAPRGENGESEGWLGWRRSSDGGLAWAGCLSRRASLRAPEEAGRRLPACLPACLPGPEPACFFPIPQVGKLHFGYILGWTVVGSVLIWFVLNSIAASAGAAAPSPDDAAGRSIDLYSCCCLLGYCLLPLVLHALLALLLPRCGIWWWKGAAPGWEEGGRAPWPPLPPRRAKDSLKTGPPLTAAPPPPSPRLLQKIRGHAGRGGRDGAVGGADRGAALPAALARAQRAARGGGLPLCPHVRSLCPPHPLLTLSLLTFSFSY